MRGHTSLAQIDAMMRAVEDGSEMLIGVCLTCEDRHWFAVDDVGESCPADRSEERAHAVNYYVLVGVKRSS